MCFLTKSALFAFRRYSVTSGQIALTLLKSQIFVKFGFISRNLSPSGTFEDFQQRTLQRVQTENRIILFSNFSDLFCNTVLLRRYHSLF